MIIVVLNRYISLEDFTVEYTLTMPFDKTYKVP